MLISIVGATGRIGAPLTRLLLAQGHQVRALSRGGRQLDALVGLGAEPFIGSFDADEGHPQGFFDGADAAFVMVKTDWSNPTGHYPVVARRLADAIAPSSVRLAVNLSAIGADVEGRTGHFEGFRILEETLDELDRVDLVHLRAGWFMENLLAWTDAVARYGRIGWSLDPDLKTPWVAVRDIAVVAAHELNNPTGRHRLARELGAEDLTMPEIAAVIAREIGRHVEYVFVDRRRSEVREAYLTRFGDLEHWIDDGNSLAALNERRVRFHTHRAALPTTMDAFVREDWKPSYEESLADGSGPETFQTWSSAPRS